MHAQYEGIKCQLQLVSDRSANAFFRFCANQHQMINIFDYFLIFFVVPRKKIFNNIIPRARMGY